MTSLSYEIKAGRAAHRTLAQLARHASTEDLRKALNEASSAVKSGSTLSDALKGQPKVFGPSVYWMVRLGEKGNVLDQCLKRIGAQLGREAGTGTTLASVPFVKISGGPNNGGVDDF
jgi:type II secretory pathway component PulF